VAHPDDVIGVAVVDKTVDMDKVKRIIYFEVAYTEIKRAHGQDHRKGHTLYARLEEQFENIGRELCKKFTSVCLICITQMKLNRPVPWIKPIITHCFGTQGQVDLIDFQSMPDGNFCFLINYVDHGVKFLFSIPLTCKHASCIAVALLEVFTVVGPPMFLHLDNGNEFNTAAMTRKQFDEFCGNLVRLTVL
jgi:hypothetical protein